MSQQDSEQNTQEINHQDTEQEEFNEIKNERTDSFLDSEKINIQADTINNDDGEVEETGEKKVKMTEISVPKVAYEKYKLQPKVIGENRILFLNAQDESFYYRQLKTPTIRLWILLNNDKLSYPTKRLIEVGWKMNIQVDAMVTGKFDLIASSEGLDEIFYDGKKVQPPDAVLPRLGANVDYFGLAVLRQLERMDIFVMNSSNSLEISRDKLYTLQHLAEAGIPIPKTMMAKFPVQIEGIGKEFKFPLILKKSSGSQGKGVMLIPDESVLSDMSDMLDTSHPLIFQEYISKSSGRDLRVFVVGGRPVGAMMRVAKTGFKANFHQGGYVKPVKLSPAVEWLAIESSRLLGLDVSGVDILIDENTYKICEINSSPGYQGFELATNIDVAQKILEFVQLRTGVWRKHFKVKKVTTVPIQVEHLINEKESPKEGSKDGSSEDSPAP